ncbi:hypothetical protein RchiOBHm_Chr4g0441241 [Rosa chinensis]|uniref:Uncharacterized protein n=1 Tax=Rosa chinensis TaxID=74649 RepID=A0A2P6R3B7_ROSCH|nr:leucine-rich repeat extensin-like protein 3 [Rosa chinensis]PRQ40911.1 hypothetical protein RchiOBHm_Chr4g0441241 [Rosa chinensis]
MTHCFKFLSLFLVAVALLGGGASVRAQDGSEKCGSCATPSPPPPSPPPPSQCPPPPALPPPTPVLPPPSPKNPPPSTSYCPPPPSSLIYITGPPGQLYPVDQDFNGAHGVRNSVGLPILLGLGLLVFWRFGEQAGLD